MSTNSHRGKFPLFIGCLILIAIGENFTITGVFNSFHRNTTRFSFSPTTTPTPSPTPAVAAPALRPVSTEKAPVVDSAAVEHARLQARYINAFPTRKADTKLIACVAANEQKQIDRGVGEVVAAKLRNDQVQISTSVFRPEFIADGWFENAFDGSTEPQRQLELGAHLDALLLVRQKTDYSTDASLENVITAKLHAEVAFIPTDGVTPSQAWSFTASGSGFHQADARQMAQERLLKQIANANNMTLDF